MLSTKDVDTIELGELETTKDNYVGSDNKILSR
jgi:hypothetical protein